MRNIFLLWLISAILPDIAAAQDILYVKDRDTNLPLAGANIGEPSGNMLFATDNNGKVLLPDTLIGRTVQVSYIGYKAFRQILVHGKNTIFLTPDYQVLNNLTVVGYDNPGQLKNIAGAYAINTSRSMHAFNDESLVRSMNTLPGIRVEERSPGSYRVSMRGNLLRAPYGVRNVKVYWNNLPLTDPTGSTPLNLLDLNNIGRVEVIHGPAGSIYGAGNGGVLNILSAPTGSQPLTAQLGFSAGSYGYQKLIANLSTTSEKHQFSMNFANQKSDGYRDHTQLDRKVLQLGGTFFTSQKRTLSAQVLFSDMYYQLPGGLTQEQYDENPRQARPGAAEKNSSIDHQNFMFGLAQDYVWNDAWSNSTSLYFSHGIKENPFITNYELEKLDTYGGRSAFNLHTSIFDLPSTIVMGAEAMYGTLNADNHGNVLGYADTLRYRDKLQLWQSFVFAQADVELASRWKLTLGASVNYLDYDIHRLRDVALDTAYHVRKKFDPVFLPRIGIVGRLQDRLYVHGAISSGFSPPTTDEVRTSDGGINESLQAEQGINYEAGLRGDMANGRLFYDATFFWMQQKETIVSRTTAGGSAIYENAGSTSQAGMELLAGYDIIRNPASAISLLRIQTAFTHHNFTFKDYQKRSRGQDVDYSGNALTGTAPNISVTSMELESQKGFYFNFTFNFTDRIPLNDANTVYAESYQLVSAKTGWKINWRKKHLVELSVGVDNLLNEKYSLGNDLNAFGGRYFNPAPERNYYGGLKIFFNKYESDE